MVSHVSRWCCVSPGCPVKIYMLVVSRLTIGCTRSASSCELVNILGD